MPELSVLHNGPVRSSCYTIHNSGLLAVNELSRSGIVRSGVPLPTRALTINTSGSGGQVLLRFWSRCYVKRATWWQKVLAVLSEMTILHGCMEQDEVHGCVGDYAKCSKTSTAIPTQNDDFSTPNKTWICSIDLHITLQYRQAKTKIDQILILASYLVKTTHCTRSFKFKCCQMTKH